MTKDEALKLALETLENSRVFVMSREMIKQPEGADWYDNRINAIKEALDECDEDELIIRYHEMTIKRLEKRIEELTAQPEQEKDV
jgi:chromosome condensin MukBEF ATPase and DNA-binding subunit MukB